MIKVCPLKTILSSKTEVENETSWHVKTRLSRFVLCNGFTNSQKKRSFPYAYAWWHQAVVSMSCTSPVIGYFGKTIGASGRRQITFNKTSAYSPAPLRLPCGKCLGCLQARGRTWGMRCEHERKLHSESCFITLTYDPEKIPKGHTLKKSDLKRFINTLRKHLWRTYKKKVRFYACGEYGTKTYRPHYHILLFGWEPPKSDRRLLRNSGSDNQTYSSLTLNRLWDCGHVVCGSLSLHSALYVASYISKNHGRQWEFDIICDDGEVIRREKEFSLMSRRPGIGSGYVQKYSGELLAHDNIILDGRSVPVPRYYDNQLLKHNYETEKEQRDKKENRHRKNWQSLKKENTPERRRVRAAYTELTMKQFRKGEI